MRATGLLQVPWRRFTARLRSFCSIYEMHSLLVRWKSFNQYVWHKVNAQHNLVVATWCCGVVYMWHKLGHQLERRETWMQEKLCSVFKAMTWSTINCVTRGKSWSGSVGVQEDFRLFVPAKTASTNFFYFELNSQNTQKPVIVPRLRCCWRVNKLNLLF